VGSRGAAAAAAAALLVKRRWGYASRDIYRCETLA